MIILMVTNPFPIPHSFVIRERLLVGKKHSGKGNHNKYLYFLLVSEGVSIYYLTYYISKHTE